jgi:squalene synthase HpnC
VIHRAFGAASKNAPVPLPSQPLELAACYRYCEAVARSRHHNFPVASHFASSRLRKHIFAIYAFARAADDFADEAEYAGRRASELDRWEEQLDACFHGLEPQHPVFVALADTVREFDLPITPFHSLLSGFRSDLELRRYSTYADLRSHTALAAEPMAHLFLYLMGQRQPELHRFGAELAAGLALASSWQDLRADLGRDRVYIPLEDLKHFGVRVDDLLALKRSPELGLAIRYQVMRTRAVFERARPLIDRVGDELAVELALMWHGGMRILDKIAAEGDAVVVKRPSLTSVDKARVVAKSVAWRGGSLLRRAKRRAKKTL